MPPKTASVDRPVWRPSDSASCRIWTTSSPGRSDDQRSRSACRARPRVAQEPGKDRDEEGGRLAGSGLGLAGHVAAGERERAASAPGSAWRRRSRPRRRPSDLVGQVEVGESKGGQVLVGGGNISHARSLTRGSASGNSFPKWLFTKGFPWRGRGPLRFCVFLSGRPSRPGDTGGRTRGRPDARPPRSTTEAAAAGFPASIRARCGRCAGSSPSRRPRSGSRSLVGPTSTISSANASAASPRSTSGVESPTAAERTIRTGRGIWE